MPPPPPIIKVILIKYKYFIYYFKVSFIFIKFQTFLFLLNKLKENIMSNQTKNATLVGGGGGKSL